MWGLLVGKLSDGVPYSAGQGRILSINGWDGRFARARCEDAHLVGVVEASKERATFSKCLTEDIEILQRDGCSDVVNLTKEVSDGSITIIPRMPLLKRSAARSRINLYLGVDQSIFTPMQCLGEVVLI